MTQEIWQKIKTMNMQLNDLADQQRRMRETIKQLDAKVVVTQMKADGLMRLTEEIEILANKSDQDAHQQKLEDERYQERYGEDQ